MIDLRVCIGSSCHIKGCFYVIRIFQKRIEENSLEGKINFQSNFCADRCQNPGVAVLVNGEAYQVTRENAQEFFDTQVTARL